MLDREVLDLLRGDPELLAIADAIASTQPPETGESSRIETKLARWRRRLLRSTLHALTAAKRRATI